MAKENNCPHCRKEFSRGSPQGLGPSCLLEAGQVRTEELRTRETVNLSPYQQSMTEAPWGRVGAARRDPRFEDSVGDARSHRLARAT